MDISANANISLANNTYTNPDNLARDIQKIAAPQAAVTNPDVVGVAVTPVTNKESKSQNKGDLSKKDQEMLKSSKGVVFEYDKLSGESVVKFMDAKGNVVSQMPPEQYLKMKQLMGHSKSFEIQGVEGDIKDMRTTGILLDKKV
jgi:uncharacterized FlaG/YvyC family protein